MRTSSLPSYPEKFGSRLRYCLAERKEQKEQARPANGNRSKHRYAGLLRCQECGNVFVPMIRYWNGKRRVGYVCNGYQRIGKSYCSSHLIHEETLDTMMREYLTAARASRVKEREKLVKLQKMWVLRKPILDAQRWKIREPKSSESTNSTIPAYSIFPLHLLEEEYPKRSILLDSSLK